MTNSRACCAEDEYSSSSRPVVGEVISRQNVGSPKRYLSDPVIPPISEKMTRRSDNVLLAYQLPGHSRKQEGVKGKAKIPVRSSV